MITRVKGETPPALKRRLGQWRLERDVGGEHSDQLAKLALLQDHVESQLNMPVKKRRLVGNIGAEGLNFSVMAAYKLKLSLANAALDAEVQDYDTEDYSNYLANICLPNSNLIDTKIVDVTVPATAKETDGPSMSNVYLDFALRHEESGAAYAYEKMAELTGYTGLVLPRTSHLRIMSVHTEEAALAKTAVLVGLEATCLKTIHLDELLPRRVVTW